MREAAVFLSPEAPYPVVGGGPLRAASLVEYLAGRYDVDLIVFREPGSPDPREAFPPSAIRQAHVIELPPHSPRALPRALRNARRLLIGTPPLVHRFAGYARSIRDFVHGRAYAVGVVGRLWCAPYWAQIAPRSRRTVLDVVDVESVLFARYAEESRWPIAAAHRRFAGLARSLERRWLGRYDTVLASSPHDELVLRELVPRTDVIVYPNALPARAAPLRRETEVVVFSGNLAYPPNVLAVRLFRRSVWPRLRDRWPGLVWRLVGKNPETVSRYVRDDPRIELTGPVPDAVAELATARVAVVPIRVGSSTRVKILEAWAAGCPIVSTTIGAEGLEARDGENLLVADDPAGFAEAVSSLLASEELRHRVGRAGRLTYEASYTWDVAWQQLRTAARF